MRAFLDSYRSTSLWLGLAIALGAVVVGAALGFVGPLITAGALLSLLAAVAVISRMEFAVWGVIAVIFILPFGSLPFKVVFTPTFLDLALVAVIVIYAWQWMRAERRQVNVTPAHLPVVAFLALCGFSFVVGLPNGPLTSNLIRQFAEMLLSILFALILVDILDEHAVLNRLMRIILIGGTLAALMGVAFYVLPDALAEQVLTQLDVFGYPGGGIIRYIEDNPELAERAISTSVDPNALGGTLAMIGALLAPQLLVRKPLLGSRVLTYAAFGVVVLCLVLTFSRGAMAALLAGLLLIAAARYRWIFVLMAFGGVLFLFLPFTQDYIQRFTEGLQGQDLATQMRFGEYKDALILIERYPVLGVGFSGAPENDIYLGVSNAYLLMASKMGLVGLTVFALAIGTVFGWAFSRRQAVYADENLTAIWLGLLAGLVAALTVGIFDHYFFNLAFQAAGALFWIFIGLALAATRLARES